MAVTSLSSPAQTGWCSLKWELRSRTLARSQMIGILHPLLILVRLNSLFYFFFMLRVFLIISISRVESIKCELNFALDQVLPFLYLYQVVYHRRNSGGRETETATKL